jgi:hypothetical protein
MKPGKYPLVLYRGDTYHWQFVLWADESKITPADLTAVTPKAEIRDKPSGSKVIAMTCTVEAPNLIKMVLAADASAKLLPTGGVWDLQLTYASGDVSTVLAGTVTVIADVTDSRLITTGH